MFFFSKKVFFENLALLLFEKNAICSHFPKSPWSTVDLHRLVAMTHRLRTTAFDEVKEVGSTGKDDEGSERC